MQIAVPDSVTNESAAQFLVNPGESIAVERGALRQCVLLVPQITFMILLQSCAIRCCRGSIPKTCLMLERNWLRRLRLTHLKLVCSDSFWISGDIEGARRGVSVAERGRLSHRPLPDRPGQAARRQNHQPRPPQGASERAAGYWVLRLSACRC